MEPRQSSPASPYERIPTNRGEILPPRNEQGEVLENGRFEIAAERPATQETEGLPPVLPSVPIAIPVVQDDNGQTTSATPLSTNPATAADEDLIEREWVDKAKKIIEQTKEDPYKRELEIGKLQRDYIRKRYGREIGEPGNV